MDYKGYDIIKQIGKGSFSNVYLCKQKYHILIDNGYKDDLFIIKEININEFCSVYLSCTFFIFLPMVLSDNSSNKIRPYYRF